MDLGLQGKKAVVCGASRGMGLAIARRLLREGCDVAILARHGADLKKAAADLAPGSRGRVYPFVLDLQYPSRIPAAFRLIKRKLGAPDILVNNAGGPPPGGFMEVADADWQKTYERNLKSVIVMTREAVPSMKANRFGRILTIASQVVIEPQPRMILSNTIRSGAAAFLKTISFELAPFNITVNTLCPGAILTDRLVSLMDARAKREKRPLKKVVADVEASIPAKRIGKPEEFADLAAFLVSERAGFITGTLIPVDGGITRSLM